MLLQFSRLAHVDQQADPRCQNLFIEPFTSSSSVGAFEHMTEDTWTGTILIAARPHVDWRDVRVTVRSIPFSEEGFDRFRTTARLDACEVAFQVAWPDPADDEAPASKRRRNVDVDWLQRSKPAKEPGPGADSHSSSLEAELEAILDEDALNHFRDLRELVREAAQMEEGATSGEEELGLQAADAQREDEQEGEEDGEVGVVVVDGHQVEVIVSLDAELERAEARVFWLFVVCSLRWVGKAIATHRLYCRCE